MTDFETAVANRVEQGQCATCGMTVKRRPSGAWVEMTGWGHQCPRRRLYPATPAGLPQIKFQH